ncbi:uncharacterized protein LOC120701941 [Panicum virgatum]|uniref:uncharacterized protein LOC120701941 n=1 Tax=Panicum virgatum TaxID=38727 RepID=UPI0019D5846D|nr:uncharacterized protein LOC120701941 [Panicum virgatum]
MPGVPASSSRTRAHRRAPGARDLASFSVGINRVDLTKCRERGIRVTNTPDVLTDDVADLAVGLAITVCSAGFVESGFYVTESSDFVEEVLTFLINSQKCSFLVCITEDNIIKMSRSERLQRWREEKEESNEDDVVFLGAMLAALKRKKNKIICLMQ